MTPNTVFAGTANRTMTQVSQKAWRASGVVIDDQTAPRPSPNVRTNTTATGSASRSARYPSAANRSAYLARTAFSSSRDSRYPRYEHQGHDEQCKQKPDPGVGDVDSERALRSIQREQRQPGDDGGERERQVDERVHDALAAELVPHEDPGDERARDRVDRHDRDREEQRQLERRDGLRAGDRPPERSEAAIERASDHRGQRQQDDDR